ncbi:hypothetical protein P152DRAFT_445455 [Eremomyces bilateralis CBS 781.70]|uniref:Uncharacterized protein n=1 Tax=Eremomyces bilateralis CBS 781.70 TaxID=1392243 RepID=A0A6G1GH70_9PEZI|nr:uncharacterized protein P152DRAFT_445455 [Eremomyces bilateralis CBS 781.70]KAF1817354.1 hypothetical protein P152DRAFT_445455 [Eremomyces bilateralis CBS 781.70]
MAPTTSAIPLTDKTTNSIRSTSPIHTATWSSVYPAYFGRFPNAANHVSIPSWIGATVGAATAGLVFGLLITGCAVFLRSQRTPSKSAMKRTAHHSREALASRSSMHPDFRGPPTSRYLSPVVEESLRGKEKESEDGQGVGHSTAREGSFTPGFVEVSQETYGRYNVGKR